jgi:hypothetical protein
MTGGDLRRDGATSRLIRKLVIRACVRIVFLLAGTSGLYGDDVAFTFQDVSPGDYRLVIEGGSIRPKGLGGLVASAGRTLRLDLEVELPDDQVPDSVHAGVRDRGGVPGA